MTSATPLSVGGQGLSDAPVSGRPGGLSSATEPVPVSALRASIPDAHNDVEFPSNAVIRRNAAKRDEGMSHE